MSNHQDSGVGMQDAGNRMEDSGVVISCRNLSKTFAQGELNVPVLNGVNLDVARGERIAILNFAGLDLPGKGADEFQQVRKSILEARDGHCHWRQVGVVHRTEVISWHDIKSAHCQTLPGACLPGNNLSPFPSSATRSRDSSASAWGPRARAGLPRRNT